MGAGVRVSVEGDIIGEHGVEDPRVYRRSRLHIEVERPAGDLDSFHHYSARLLLQRLHSGRSSGGGEATGDNRLDQIAADGGG